MVDVKKIRARLEEARLSEMSLTREVARDVSFHMTDWLENLRQYITFCENPESLSIEQVDSMLLGFLQHVPNHVAAAAKLYADSPATDVFGVGAVREGSGDA